MRRCTCQYKQCRCQSGWSWSALEGLGNFRKSLQFDFEPSPGSTIGGNRQSPCNFHETQIQIEIQTQMKTQIQLQNYEAPKQSKWKSVTLEWLLWCDCVLRTNLKKRKLCTRKNCEFRDISQPRSHKNTAMQCTTLLEYWNGSLGKIPAMWGRILQALPSWPASFKLFLIMKRIIPMFVNQWIQKHEYKLRGM